MDETTTTAGATPAPEQADTVTVTETPTAEDYAKLQSALKAANKEAADRRKKLDAFEKAEADRKSAEMTDLQKAQAEADKLKSELTAARREAIAARHGLPPELAARVVGDTPEDMDADAAKLAALITKPAQQPAAQSQSSPAAPAATPALSPDVIAKMTPAEINKQWEAVSAALQKGK